MSLSAFYPFLLSLPLRPLCPLDDPDFTGAEAALERAAETALARIRAAGLEPVVAGDRGRA